MEPWDSVAIYGVGLIGGSIGMAIRKRGLAREVVGIGRDQRLLDRAVALGAIDRGSLDLASAVSQADLVIVATPVHRIVEHIRQVRANCKSECLVTDAGSTKRLIVSQIDRDDSQSFRGTFIGSHPLAGSERTGVEAASADLFSDRVVVLTPTDRSPSAKCESLAQFWENLGANVSRMSAEEHDRVLAQTSHLPHIVASALAASTPPEHLPLTATGWSDSTRIASGDVGLWVEILLQNRTDVLSSLQRFDDALTALRDALRDADSDALAQLLSTGKQRRDSVGN